MTKILYEAATELYGNECQIIKTSEEAGELVQAIAQYLLSVHPDRHPNTDYDPHEMAINVIREAVQVQIMIEQLKSVFDHPGYWIVIEREEKKRLRERLVRDGCPKCGTELEEDPEDSSEGYCPKCNYGWRFPR